MMNKRHFLLGTCGTLSAPLARAAGSIDARGPLEACAGLATWQQYLGESFRLDTDGRSLGTLRLSRLHIRGSQRDCEQFTLGFAIESAQAVPPGLYHLTHAQGDGLWLRLEAAGRDGLRAEFSRLRAA
jgi:hypothetical protein